MAKVRTTRKAIKEAYPQIYSVEYNALQMLLNYESPVYYTAGRYGAGADVYILSDYAVLTTGYSPFGKALPYDYVRAWDEKAERLIGDYSRSCDEQKAAVKALYAEFVADVLKKKGAVK